MKQSELFKKWKKDLGQHHYTQVIGTGKQAFSMKIFESCFLLKRANRGEIVLDRLDLWALKDTIIRFENKKEIIKSLED